jgi:hypothetical protein
MIKVLIDEEDLLEMLLKRVKYWTDDTTLNALFKQMYENRVYGGCFEGMELDIPLIVDNDYVNNYSVVSEGDEGYEELLKIYEQQGLGDCSCESDNYNYIEAYENDTFLVS